MKIIVLLIMTFISWNISTLNAKTANVCLPSIHYLLSKFPNLRLENYQAAYRRLDGYLKGETTPTQAAVVADLIYVLRYTKENNYGTPSFYLFDEVLPNSPIGGVWLRRRDSQGAFGISNHRLFVNLMRYFATRNVRKFDDFCERLATRNIYFMVSPKSTIRHVLQQLHTENGIRYRFMQLNLRPGMEWPNHDYYDITQPNLPYDVAWKAYRIDFHDLMEVAKSKYPSLF